MYRIAVCDENEIFLDKLCCHLIKWSKLRAINADIARFYDGTDLLDNIRDYGYYQVVILDMEIRGANGLFLAEYIQKQNMGTLIVFMSAYEHYYKQAYQVHSYYFFTKPIHVKELYSVMNGAVVQSEISDQAFRFYHKMMRYNIPIREILYFFSDRRRICIVCKDKKRYWFYGRLDQVEEVLKRRADKFLRIHKSFFVNSRYVRVFGYEYVEMADQERLPISRPRRKDLRRQQMEMAVDI